MKFDLKCPNLHYKKYKTIKFEPTWDWLEPSLESLQRIHVKEAVLIFYVSLNFLWYKINFLTLIQKQYYWRLVAPVIDEHVSEEFVDEAAWCFSKTSRTKKRKEAYVAKLIWLRFLQRTLADDFTLAINAIQLICR